MSGKNLKDDIDSNFNTLTSNESLQQKLIETPRITTKPNRMSSAERSNRRVEARIKRVASGKHPLQKAGLISILFFFWVNPILWIGRRRPFEQHYHPRVPAKDSVAKNELAITQKYAQKHSIGKSVFSLFFWGMTKNFILMGISQFLLCFVAILMFLVLELINNGTKTGDDAMYWYAGYFGAIAGFQLFGHLFFNYVQNDLSRLSVRLKSAVTFMAYQKLFKVGVLNPKEHTESNILNYIQVDAQKMEDAITKFAMLFESFWQIIFGFSISIYLVSYNIAACFVAFVSLTIFTFMLYKFIFKYEVRFMIAKDLRTQLLKNILHNLKFIKMRVWENFYHAKLYIKRQTELAEMGKSNFVFTLIVALNWFNPTSSFLLTFVSMLLFDFPLIPGVVLAYTKIFATFLKGMANVPNAFQFLVEMRVSLKRLNYFIDSMEVEDDFIEKANAPNAPFAIQLEDGSFYWVKTNEKEMQKRRDKSRKVKIHVRKFGGNQFVDPNAVYTNQSMRSYSVNQSTYQDVAVSMNVSIATEDGLSGRTGSINSKISKNPTLAESLLAGDKTQKINFQVFNLNFSIPKGSLTMIFGPIGSGKSSLLYALMGEMNPMYQHPRPRLRINGSLFYVGQKPWLLTMSIRDNIILDKEFVQERFDRAVKLSALDSDIAMFDEGAERIISDGADNLSGGQKTRVALARAIYQK